MKKEMHEEMLWKELLFLIYEYAHSNFPALF